MYFICYSACFVGNFCVVHFGILLYIRFGQIMFCLCKNMEPVKMFIILILFKENRDITVESLYLSDEVLLFILHKSTNVGIGVMDPLESTLLLWVKICSFQKILKGLVYSWLLYYLLYL